MDNTQTTNFIYEAVNPEAAPLSNLFTAIRTETVYPPAPGDPITTRPGTLVTLLGVFGSQDAADEAKRLSAETYALQLYTLGNRLDAVTVTVDPGGAYVVQAKESRTFTRRLISEAIFKVFAPVRLNAVTNQE
jgi:hypothetical protein